MPLGCDNQEVRTYHDGISSMAVLNLMVPGQHGILVWRRLRVQTSAEGLSKVGVDGLARHIRSRVQRLRRMSQAVRDLTTVFMERRDNADSCGVIFKVMTEEL